jgi:Integrase core domain
MCYIPPGTWNNGYIESFNNRLRKECLNRNHWNTLFEARVVIGDFKHEHNQRHGPGLPNAGRVRCGLQAHPHPGRLRDQLNPKPNNPTLIRVDSVSETRHPGGDPTIWLPVSNCPGGKALHVDVVTRGIELAGCGTCTTPLLTSRTHGRLG